MSRLLTKTLAAVTLSIALAGAAAPANADVPLPPRGTGSSLVDGGSSLLQTGSTIFVNPLPALIGGFLCSLNPGSGLCNLRDL
ncbi:hypothetical protein [Nocardia aurantiaca]|uniref:Chaplin domain-containing protein n=1 Tax=Nocardia aurantiaca TaxID=2675850 RepID=A0A6I3L691_9NOCA|nr:hypothetical protein [Nocardia aurantiaca]MTE16480.1 hypothetical protein [Nocardia aurantiaca]